ncbi:hypothetical protein [Paenibacillus monticola]|uniref:Aminotransferase class I/classII domain-containing protein n=1 Tax=Paenibacillus monticola TaxID=2666075 RepID=A0A7X2H8F8_9BACL|nr:hypothetical protein [Paenibacillus monticola]MRN55429.1 hypothetical protein [Paenibacillus monticola]
MKKRSPVSLLQQRIIHQFILSGHWENHLRKITVANKRKYDLLIRTIQEWMGDKVTIHGGNAGLHILLESSQGLSESDMIKRAKVNRVLVYPVSTFWLEEKRYSDNMVLLGFGNVPEANIVDGVRQLAKAWEI